MLEPIRVTVRLSFLFFWTIGWFGARVSVLPVVLVCKPAERVMRRTILRAWAWGVCAIMRARITVRGTAPTAPYLLVSNHLGYFDTIVYARILGCVFVSMAEVDAWPLIGTLARAVNTLFIDRKRRRDTARANRDILRALESGDGIVLFPESTTTYGDRVLPFHAPLLQPAVDLGRPVHYAAIAYAAAAGENTAERVICWVDDTPFAAHALRFLRLRAFEATVVFGGEPLRGTDRKVLATALHDAVTGIAQHNRD